MPVEARLLEERRVGERLPLQASVVLVLIRCRHEVSDPAAAAPVISSWTATTLNASASGLLCETAAPVQAGETVSVVWSVPGPVPLPTVLPARVTRVDASPPHTSQVALRFLDVPFQVRDAIARAVAGNRATASALCGDGR